MADAEQVAKELGHMLSGEVLSLDEGETGHVLLATSHADGRFLLWVGEDSEAELFEVTVVKATDALGVLGFNKE